LSGELSRLIKPDGGDRQDQDELTNEHSQGQRQTFQGYFLLHQPTPEHYRTVKNRDPKTPGLQLEKPVKLYP
jgi:hypothetical protein